MLSAEAKEAREVIGGIAVVFPHVHTAETTHGLQKLESEKVYGVHKGSQRATRTD